MIYLDTSAFLKLYFLEQGSQEIQDRVVAQDEPLPVWDMLEAEFSNAMYLKVFWKELTLEEARTQLDRFADRKQRGFYHSPLLDRARLMAVFSELREKTPQFGCRTMDILHVACACMWGASTFLTFDGRQRKLALHAGLDAPESRGEEN